MVTSTYFKEAEFNRCVPKCSLQDMEQDAMTRLDELRKAAGVPIILNSAYRSPEHEKARGRTGTGAHTTGVAFDLRCRSDGERFTLIKAAIATGCTRIGIAQGYVHVDFSPSHSQNVTWIG